MNGMIYTAHLSEMRIDNMLNDYWEKWARRDKFADSYCVDFYYWPSCPEVDAEN